VTLINRRNISIGDEWFDGILQLREAERVDIEDALDFAGEPGADIGQFAMQEAAVAQWPQRQTVVPDTAAGSHWRHRDGVPRDIVEGFVHADLAEAIKVLTQPHRYGQAGIQIEPQPLLSLVTPEVVALDVVIGVSQPVEQFLTSAQQQVGQRLHRKLLWLNQVLVPGSL